MRFFLTLFTIGIVLSVHAQQKNAETFSFEKEIPNKYQSKKELKYPPIALIPDSVRNMDRAKYSPSTKVTVIPNIAKNNSIAYDMNVIKLSNQLVFEGNNGKGFDICSSTTDNMPILSPDKNTKAELKGIIIK